MLRSISGYYTYIISFLIPAFLLGVIFIIWHVYPFGGHSILMGDSYTQYIQFYNYLYDVLKGNGSLLYSWEAGMGLNFWGTFTYYLASPISLVVLLFDRDNLPEAFVLMTLLKIGLSGLMISIYLSKIVKLEKISIITFATLYALMSFSVGFFYNIMWLDTIYLLPLVLLGVERLFHKKYLLFIISLALLFITNFYMSYMAGIFSFFYFLIRYFSHNDATIKGFFKNFSTFMFSTLIAAGMAAFLIIPTYLQLKSNAYSGNKWLGFFNVELDFFSLISKLFNSSENIFIMPNIYCGLFVLLLAPLFFVSNKIKRREKVLFAILAFFMVVSFQIKGLNIIWHAFESPSGYLQRFSFLFSFLLIYFASRSLLVFEKDLVPCLFKIYGVHVLLLILLTELTPDLMSLQKAMVNLVFLSLFVLLIYGGVVIPKYSSFIKITIFFLICVDVGLNSHSYIKSLSEARNYNIDRSEYTISTQGFDELTNRLSEEDTSFYRVNSTVGLTLNDSLRYGYRGMDNFNTMSNGILHEFMKNIGYSATLGARSLSQSNGILTSDALLGFKYFLTDQPINKYGYIEKTCEQKMCLYENENVIQAGFMMEKDQVKFNTKVDNPFENQNIFLGSNSSEVDYFKPAIPTEVNYNNLTVREENNNLYVKKTDPNLEGSIEWTFDLNGKNELLYIIKCWKRLSWI